MIELRLRSYISDAELAAKKGKILTASDFNVKLTGPARVYRPDGRLLCVYLPGVLHDRMAELWPILSGIRMATDNRGAASGTPRQQRGDQKRTRTRNIFSAVVGAVDPGPASSKAGARLPVCRLTAWTGKHLPEWDALRPLLVDIAGHFAEQVPDRYAVQQAAADRTHPDWVVPGTPFTTLTVNNTYSTGVHQDAGDLETGFSTLAVARRGADGGYVGGELVLARYRLAVDMADGDLLLFDAHEWHGNTEMRCPHDGGQQLAKPCPAGCERVSVVAYYRTKVERCESAEQELRKARDALA
jgi:hypothetical protein